MVWALPLALLVVLTALFRVTGLDVLILEFFYDPDTGAWIYKRNPALNVYNDAAQWPALVLGIGGLLVAAAGFWVVRLRRWRRSGCYLFLALVLFPGLVVNTVLKDRTGRPRPEDTRPFGGERELLKVLEFDFEGGREAGRSFPSGHAASGFFILTPYFILREWRRYRLARLFLAVGLVHGLLTGLCRVARGEHFPSDVLWSWAVVYFGGYLLAKLFRFGSRRDVEDEAGAAAAS
ncbi:phosphatase PAP2 family protein [Kiritimatiella glycovorans]|nr:phosphatase PAP2 family protein [Kiritimatiella glycovorans]